MCKERASVSWNKDQCPFRGSWILMDHSNWMSNHFYWCDGPLSGKRTHKSNRVLKPRVSFAWTPSINNQWADRYFMSISSYCDHGVHADVVYMIFRWVGVHRRNFSWQNSIWILFWRENAPVLCKICSSALGYGGQHINKEALLSTWSGWAYKKV